MAKPVVFVFARAPQYGAVKSRLARDIGTLAATRFYRHCLSGLLRRLSHDPRFDVVLATTPRLALLEAGFWPSPLARIDQGRGDLGQRMVRVLRTAGHRPALLIGSDIPDARSDHLTQSLRLLGQSDFVLGPVHDGGYWLIGARHPSRLRDGALDGVRWSTSHALTDTSARLSSAGRVACLATTLIDVDDGATLRTTTR
jgi:rSAM/selenodomain-associated transferase 1